MGRLVILTLLLLCGEEAHRPSCLEGVVERQPVTLLTDN
jgi:hypothetical protein